MDLKDVDINDLLADISGHAVKEPSPIDKWLSAEGYYPGATRVLTTELHNRYVAWRAQQPDITTKVEDVRRFGMVMKGKFKWGKLNTGNCYYISRESECVLTQPFILGGVEYGQGVTPPIGSSSKGKKT